MPMKFKIAKIAGVAVWLMLISLGPSARGTAVAGCLSGARWRLFAAVGRPGCRDFQKAWLAGGADRGGLVDAGHRGDSLGRPRHSSRRRQQRRDLAVAGLQRHGALRQRDSKFSLFGHGPAFDYRCIAAAWQAHGRDPIRRHAGFRRAPIRQAPRYGARQRMSPSCRSAPCPISSSRCSPAPSSPA